MQLKMIPALVISLMTLAASAAPSGCQTSVSGKFELVPMKIADIQKRDQLVSLQKRGACGGDTTLVVTLEDGVVKDAQGRTGYIAGNSQLQFDSPPQSGSIATSGFSSCSNNTLALADSAVWYECQSGGFSNIYTANQADQCEPIYLGAMACGADDGVYPSFPGAEVVSTTIAVVSGTQTITVATQLPVPLCQINDGQVQAHLAPCEHINVPTATVTAPSGQTSGAPGSPGSTGAPGSPGSPGSPTSSPSSGTTSSPVAPGSGGSGGGGGGSGTTGVPPSGGSTGAPNAPPQGGHSGAFAVSPDSALAALALGVAGSLALLV